MCRLAEQKSKTTKGKIFFLALIFAWGNGCSGRPTLPNPIVQTSSPDLPLSTTNIPNTPGAGEEMLETQPTDLPSSELLSSIIASIMAKPNQYAGKDVEILGYYRGWNLLAEAQNGPPVTRSDWVIANLSGAMYVTGPGPQNLDPSSKKDIWVVIRVLATVEHDPNGRPYLVARKLEQVPSK